MGIFTCAGSVCIAAEQIHKSLSTIDPKQDLLNPPTDAPVGKYRCTLWVNVPHSKGCVDKFRAVPYLSEMPTALHTYGNLSEKYSDLKQSLYLLCYVAPQNPKIHRYSGQGWRFTYALQAAERELGEGPPHFLPEIQGWCDQMYPHLKKFIVRINEAESARTDRFNQTKDFYAENHTEIEYAALKKGYYPIDLKFMVYHLSLQRALVDLPEGKWWITGTHKVIGITYYWQEPIEVGPDKPNALELTEQNAMLIDSAGW
jgi:hypothetical protein